MSENTILEFNYNVPITESAGVNGDFLIKGIAINETTTSNNHKYLAEELRPAAKTMVGVPLLVDHDNRVECIKGRVTAASFDEMGRRIPFEAKVMDDKMKEMIKKGMLNSVSIGATVTGVDEDSDGALIPRGIKIRELSLVAVGADDKANFTIALGEAYNAKKSKVSESNDTLHLVKGGKNMDNVNNSTTEEAVKVDTAMSEKLAAAEAKIAEYAAKERKSLEESYAKVCSEKNCDALDVSKMSSEMIEALMTQMKTMKVVEKIVETKVAESPAMKVAEKPVAKVEESEEEFSEEADSKHNFMSEAGSIRGGSYTLIR